MKLSKSAKEELKQFSKKVKEDAGKIGLPQSCRDDLLEFEKRIKAQLKDYFLV